jgi:hypothetical protein
MTHPIRVGFLFLGPASHIAHSASIAFELAAMENCEATALVSSPQNARMVRELAVRYGRGIPNVEWLHAGLLHRLARLFKKRAYPRVRYVIDNNLHRLQEFDALVMTDAHPMRWGREHRRPRLVLAGHGAGIRAHGRYAGMGTIDLFLLPGRAKFERLEQMGHVDAGRSRIIGYPKFDIATPDAGPLKLFDNDKPVVIYNPHFNAAESSWPRWGHQVLDHFLASPDLNLVFAPHLLLFGRGRGRLPRKYVEAPNIHVDLHGPALTDMRYTMHADIYLGDVSSQAYEFVGHRPRPCIFLDPHRRDWRRNGNLQMWHMGAVVDDIARLGAELRLAAAKFPQYLPQQERLVAAAFDLGELPAGRRGALAIAELLRR